MNFKFVCFLLFLLVLRAGLVKSIDEIESANTYDNVTKSGNTTSKEKPISTKSSPSNNIPPDKCSVFGTTSYCTSEKPYCFVDGDNIYCGSVEESGWRISPIDGLVLNNGQKPNPNCILFNPPEQPETKRILMNILNYSSFGSGFKGRESAWFNTFEYLGNCPLRSQYCDKNTLTCQNLFDAGVNCTSSNQCLSRYCDKYDINAPDDTTERRCVKVNDSDTESSFKGVNDNKKDNGSGSLLILISISVGTSILLLAIIAFLMKVQRKKKSHLIPKNQLLPSNYSSNDTTINQTRFVTKNFSLSSLRSSLFSRMSSNKSYSKNIKRDSSDQFSILLPPPPTFNRDIFLYRNNDNNNHHHNHLDNASVRDSLDSLDSFDIYSPNYIQKQYETSFI